MTLNDYTTLRTEHIHRLAQTFANQEYPPLARLHPIADFEELLTFAETHPTPLKFTPESPAWRLDSVASRVIEALAIAAHEPLTELGYRELARILLEHTEYLYAYPEGDPRPRREAGAALALASTVSASLPHSELWRLAGFGRIADTPSPVEPHLALPIDLAFLLAYQQNLPVLETAVARFKRDFAPRMQFKLPLSDTDFFATLNLTFPGMAAVKTALSTDDIPTAKSAYTRFRRELLKNLLPDTSLILPPSDTYDTAKMYLECLHRLSIYPTPAITATTEIGIAAHLFPEFRGSEQLRHLARRRYQWIADTLFHPDGFHKDRTLRSHIEAITNFRKLCYFESDELRPFLEKLVETCILISQPDWTFPPLGPAPDPDFDAHDLCTLVDSDFQGDQDFPISDITSHGLPETGCYIFRNNWTPEAQYLFLDARPKTEPDADAFSTAVLHAHRQHLTTAAVRIPGVSPVLPTTPSDTHWITHPTFDLLEKWDDTPPLHYKRLIFYLKGEYFVCHDLLLSEDAQTLEQAFQFRNGIDVHIDADSGWSRTQQNLCIGTTDTANLKIIKNGDTLIYRHTSEPPASFNTVLFPMGTSSDAVPEISAIRVHTDPDVLATGFTCQLGSTTDTFLISDDGYAEMSALNIRFIGEYLCLREGTARSDLQFIMVNGRFLQIGSRILVDMPEPCQVLTSS